MGKCDKKSTCISIYWDLRVLISNLMIFFGFSALQIMSNADSFFFGKVDFFLMDFFRVGIVFRFESVRNELT